VPHASAEPQPLLEVRDLRVHFPVHRGVLGRVVDHIRAVDDVSFQLQKGQTLGVVGESGCGKTTLGRAVLRLIPATSGEIDFDGVSVLKTYGESLRQLRRQMQIVFQDPAGSLNARMKVGEIVGEPLLVHKLASGKELKRKVAELLDRCGLPADAAERYPHQFSGGQKQRIGIARALSLRPKLIVCDEPTSALDVSVQSQILNLLKDLQEAFELSYIFISHDMAVVHHMCDRIAVMHQGRLVELGDAEQVISKPQHEYTQRLLDAVPDMLPRV
jgi:oligopeptide transport system ATP-binding protein